MKNNLIIMVGCPGSGKTTYAKENYPDAWYVSRDEIRFNLVSENEEYFSKEDQVFNQFINKINEGLRNSHDVIADATHLNSKSRFKLLANLTDLDKEKTNIVAIFMRTPLNVCIARNEKRKNTRSYVPEDVIRNMYKALRKPNFEECYGMIDKIHIVETKEGIN